MKQKVDGFIVGMKVVIISCVVIVLATWTPGLVRDYKWSVERKARMEQWEKNGISPVTRGQGVRDTLRIDSIKLKN